MFVFVVVLFIVWFVDFEVFLEVLMVVGFKVFIWVIKRLIIGFMCDFLVICVFCFFMWYYLIRGLLDVIFVFCDYVWGWGGEGGL